MQAIVVVKVHDNLDLSKTKANVCIKTPDKKKVYRNHMKVRPMMDKSIKIQIYDKALEMAAAKLYMSKGCVGGGACNVATTGYSEKEKMKRCTNCWKDVLIEMAIDEVLGKEKVK